MEITERRITLALMTIVFVAGLLACVYALVAGNNALNVVVALPLTLIGGLVLYLYWRGWEPVRYALIVQSVLAVLLLQEPFITQQYATAVFAPLVLALVLGNGWWIIGSAVVTMGSLLIRAQGQGVYADPVGLIIYLFIVVGLVLARIIAHQALAKARISAEAVERTLSDTQKQSLELAEAHSIATARLGEQQRLLDLVTTLELPVVQLADGILLAPLVGHLDTRRIDMITNRLLEAAHTRRARLIVIDIAGVAMVDTAVAQALLHMAQGLRLLGCSVALSSISSNVALTLTQLGINMDGIITVRSPQEALTRAFTSAPAPNQASQRAEVPASSMPGVAPLS